MGNDQNRAAFDVFPHILKQFDEVLKTPEVNSCFRFIEDRNGRPFGENRGDLDPFQFSAGKICIDFPVYVIMRAETDGRKIFACFRNGKFFAGCEPEQIQNPDSLEPYRLLKCKADPRFCALRNRFARDVFTVQQDPPTGRFFNPRDLTCECGFSTAVRTGDDDLFLRGQGKADVPDDLLFRSIRLNREKYVL